MVRCVLRELNRTNVYIHVHKWCGTCLGNVLYSYKMSVKHAQLCVNESVIQIYLFPDSMQEQQIRSMETEMDNYKKSIVKEQENNEKLTLLLNKIMADIMHVQSQIERSMAKREALKVEYMTYTRVLQETEQALGKVTTVSVPLKRAMLDWR